MPTIKCTSCGHRHFQAVSVCINCGTPLVAPASTERPSRSQARKASATLSLPSSSPKHDDEANYEEFVAEATQNEPEEQTDRPDAQAARPETSRQLVKHTSNELVSRQVWKKKTEIQAYEPYSSEIDIVPPEPFAESRIGAVTLKEEREQVIDPELWKSDKLPWYFLKIKPNIAGTVIHMESKEEIIDYPDFFAAIATLLVELIWIMTDTVQDRTSDRVVMTTVRVQTHDGSLKDTRLRGNMRGANLSLGDKVSLWGWRRRGVLFVSRGFNHTTQGVVSTNSVGLIVPALIVVVLFVVGVYFAPTWIPLLSHSITSSFGPFVSFFHKHPITLPMQKK